MLVKKTKPLPKKKKVVEYTEPVRKSVLDILHENMRLAERNTFVNRLIYIGEHCFTGALNNIGHRFQNIIEEVNGEYCDEKLSGFMIYYQKYFCHVIEGSENSISKHLKGLHREDYVRTHTSKWKVLGVTHNINQRFLDHWTAFTAKPPMLMERIDPDLDSEATRGKVMYCLHKLYKLGISLRPSRKSEFVEAPKVIDESSRRGSREIREQSRTFSISRASYSSIAVDGMTHMDYLPEVLLLEFLVNSKHLMDVKLYSDTYGHIPLSRMARDLAYPIMKDHLPQNIFEAEYDPITDLPAKPDATPLIN